MEKAKYMLKRLINGIFSSAENKIKALIVILIFMLCSVVTVLQVVDVSYNKEEDSITYKTISNNIADKLSILDNVESVIGSERVKIDQSEFTFDLPKAASYCEFSGGRIVCKLKDIQTCQISYKVFFDGGDKIFDWGSGGCLCSVSSGDKSFNSNGGMKKNSFNLCMKWNKDGFVFPSFCCNGNEYCGISIYSEGKKIESGSWHDIIIQIKSSTGNERNGKIKVSIDGVFCMVKDPFAFCLLKDTIEYITFQAYHYNILDGKNSERDQKIYIKDFCIENYVQ